MRNHILIGLGIAASVLLFFQNCGMNNNNAVDDSRLLVTPLADSGISIAQGENPFAHLSSSPASPSESVSESETQIAPGIPAHAISDLIAVNSPSACVNGYKPTEFLYARGGFTSAGTGGFFCQLPSIGTRDRLVSAVQLQSGTSCSPPYTRIGGVTYTGMERTGPSSICVQYQPLATAASYFTAIYITILDASLPALRCKSGDFDGGNIGPQFALCLHR